MNEFCARLPFVLADLYFGYGSGSGMVFGLRPVKEFKLTELVLACWHD